jgi:hypothetical protein
MLYLLYPRFQNGKSRTGRFPTRSLAEIELQFVEPSGEAIGGTDDRLGYRTDENRDGGAVHG